MTLREGVLARAVLGLLTLEIAAAIGLALIGSSRCERVKQTRPANRRLVSELGLADLALWSDASYCRHPTMAVFFSAHSDHPAAMDHFPAGSMVPPPRIGFSTTEAAP